MFDAGSRSRVASALPITMAGKSLETSFESGRDLHVCSAVNNQILHFYGLITKLTKLFKISQMHTAFCVTQMTKLIKSMKLCKKNWKLYASQVIELWIANLLQLCQRIKQMGERYTSRKLERSILPSSVKNTCNKNLSLKYHTGCWLFFTATCKSELGGPCDIFCNVTIGRCVLADIPGCSCGTWTKG